MTIAYSQHQQPKSRGKLIYDANRCIDFEAQLDASVLG